MTTPTRTHTLLQLLARYGYVPAMLLGRDVDGGVLEQDADRVAAEVERSRRNRSMATGSMDHAMPVAIADRSRRHHHEGAQRVTRSTKTVIELASDGHVASPGRGQLGIGLIFFHRLRGRQRGIRRSVRVL